MKPLMIPPLVGTADIQPPEGEPGTVLVIVAGDVAAGLDANTKSHLGVIAADARQALTRALKRAETLSGEWERVEINQSRGPRIEFTGRLLCSHEHETRGREALRITMEIWETRAGAMVAASYSEPLDREGYEDARALVVDPAEDAQAMRFAVMDFFNWSQGARSMVKKIGWSLRQEVE